MSKTPKTLNEAIENGVNESSSKLDLTEVIEMHVRDFLAQKFGSMMLSDEPDNLRSLFNSIVKKGEWQAALTKEKK